ncbi:MAG: four helix bundle protein [Candidatus Margulisbacteria bacterium]|nr:four helix bundle protein [Candidatus Margulisiibacteriota bacterium]MBU1022002.1 four helix bundle protein [Candidatus Margulisiibacteriota bacterium]MBU1729875.1 four helix bundle protein [Candidatus Margulisiibacteriota bacterium]MBU1955205.1 four helix bundle protein [Candidatus Margulisiibacteriota bacterium]
MNIWKEIMFAIDEVYKITSIFPKEEKYGIAMQMRRSAVSVASNVAEGCARYGKQEKIRFFTISKSSLSELDAQIEISFRLGFIKDNEYNQMIDKLERISCMLQGLINSQKKAKLLSCANT